MSAVVAIGAALWAGCGSTIDRAFLENGTGSFDFRKPVCAEPASPPAESVEIRYLGSGGIYAAWRNDAILIGPYFSNAGLFRALAGCLRFDEARIASGMAPLDAGRIQAILTGHSHFDHIGDVPLLLRDYVPGAIVYTNNSGRDMLAAYQRTLQPHVVSVESRAGTWIPIPRRDGSMSSIRIKPIRWEHAPQICRFNRRLCTFARCELPEPWSKPWTSQRMRTMCGGATFAYVVDFLDGDGTVRFRIFYNDSAAGGSIVPSAADAGDGHPFDVAVLCMASYHFVRDYPEALLEVLEPRHIVVSHYDDFFVKSDGSWRFVPLLTNRKAKIFFERLRASAARFSNDARGPITPVCGPMTRRWSMPVPQWPLYFVPSTGGAS
jgi:L-ascorbate metabolism protein UlaG (beta-lactamase superfamily)